MSRSEDGMYLQDEHPSWSTMLKWLIWVVGIGIVLFGLYYLIKHLTSADENESEDGSDTKKTRKGCSACNKR